MKEKDLKKICLEVKKHLEKGEIEEAKEAIQKIFDEYSDSPIPHNLLGILWEKKGCHAKAMRHFRAAWALDPSYIPARCNLEKYESIFPEGNFAYTEDDCPDEIKPKKYRVFFDAKGMKHETVRS